MPKEFPWFMLSLFMMILALYGLVVQHGSSYGINLQLWVQIGSHHEQFSFKGALHSLDTYRGFTCIHVVLVRSGSWEVAGRLDTFAIRPGTGWRQGCHKCQLDKDGRTNLHFMLSQLWRRSKSFMDIMGKAARSVGTSVHVAMQEVGNEICDWCLQFLYCQKLNISFLQSWDLSQRLAQFSDCCHSWTGNHSSYRWRLVSGKRKLFGNRSLMLLHPAVCQVLGGVAAKYSKCLKLGMLKICSEKVSIE